MLKYLSIYKFTYCVSVWHSCFPPPGNETWQVMYQTKDHNEAKVEIILLSTFGIKKWFNAPKCGVFESIYESIYANVNKPMWAWHIHQQ